MTHQYENCLKSCVELKAHSRLKSIKTSIWRRTVLSFQKVVRVTRYQRAYDLFDLVVEVGSSLGLWIGLSALGIFDLFLFAGDIVKQKIMSPQPASKQGLHSFLNQILVWISGIRPNNTYIWYPEILLAKSVISAIKDLPQAFLVSLNSPIIAHYYIFCCSTCTNYVSYMAISQIFLCFRALCWVP